MLKIAALALLTALCACSTVPPAVVILTPSPSLPGNLMTPARPLMPLLWPNPSPTTMVQPGKTPNN